MMTWRSNSNPTEMKHGTWSAEWVEARWVKAPEPRMYWDHNAEPLFQSDRTCLRRIINQSRERGTEVLPLERGLRWLLFGIHPPFGAEDGTAVIITYETRSGALVPKDDPLPISEEAVWIDLTNPTPEEEKIIEAALGLDVPTREEQQEIEVSSRLCQEGGAHFMTATVLVQTETPEPTTTPITSILGRKKAHHRAVCRASRLLDFPHAQLAA